MKHSVNSFAMLLLAIVLSAFSPLAAADKIYSGPNFTVSYPADFVAEESENSGMTIINFNPAQAEKGEETDYFMVITMCMPALKQLDATTQEMTIKATFQSLEKTLTPKFATFNMTEPLKSVNEHGHTCYDATYTGVTATKKVQRGDIRVAFAEGCLFEVLSVSETPSVYPVLHKCALSFKTLPEPVMTTPAADNATQRASDPRKAARNTLIGSSVNLTETFSRDGLSFRYPAQMAVTAEKSDDGQTQVVCNGGVDGVAVLNINYQTLDELQLLDRKEIEDIFVTSLDEMTKMLTQLYKNLQLGEPVSDPNKEYPNLRLEFSGSLFGQDMTGNIEIISLKTTYIITIVQTSTSEGMNMLENIRRTISVQ